MSNIIFEKNMEALKNIGFPFQELMKHVEEVDSKNKFEFVESRDKNLILKYNGEKTLFFNSAYRPIEEAAKWSEKYSTGELNKISLVFGVGSGYHILQLMNDLTDNDRIIIYEPSIELFITLIRNIDISRIIEDDQIILILEGINDNQFRRILASQIKWFNLERTRIIDLPQYMNVFPEQYNKVLVDFKKEVDAQIGNTTTLMVMAKDRIGNIIINLNEVNRVNVIDELVGKFDTDIPFIVVSAGPSLNKNMHLLKEAKNKAFICATDTAAKVLINNDIVPDLYVCVDPIKFDILDIENEKVWNIPVVCSLTSHYKLLKNSTGKIFIYNDGYDILNRIIKLKNMTISHLSSGGSVAHNAFALGRFLGFKRIVLVGQDLAFTNNQTHSDGAFDDMTLSKETKENAIFVEDINGNEVMTRFDFKSYLNWFEKAIASLKGEVDIIDATEGGAKIDGTKIMSLQEVIDSHCNKDEYVSTIINNMESLFDKDDIKLIDKEIDKLTTRIKLLSDKAMKAKKANIKRYEYFKNKQFGNPKFIKAEDDLEKLDKYINDSKDMVFINDLIMGVEYKMVQDSVGLAENDPEAIRIRVENKNTLYDQIEIAVKRVLSTFESVRSGNYFQDQEN